MKEIIIACKTLERELEFVIKKEKINPDIIWIESGLHNTPTKLKTRIGEELEKIDGEYQRVFLCFGTCGNFLLGLKTGKYELVIPRVDDCITLLLGSLKRRQEITQEMGTYFLTKGWLDGERNIWVEYKYSIDKYGQEEADELFEIMFSGYRRLGILDHGAYDIEKLMSECQHIGEDLKLKLERLDASMEYVRELITGPHSKERYIIVGPNTTIKLEDLDLN